MKKLFNKIPSIIVPVLCLIIVLCCHCLGDYDKVCTIEILKAKIDSCNKSFKNYSSQNSLITTKDLYNAEVFGFNRGWNMSTVENTIARSTYKDPYLQWTYVENQRIIDSVHLINYLEQLTPIK